MGSANASSDRRFSDLIAVIEATRSLASASDVGDTMSLFARELTLLFDAAACVISRYDGSTDTVKDWAAFVLPPATLSPQAEQYKLSDYPVTRRVLTEAIELSTTVGDGGVVTGLVKGPEWGPDLPAVGFVRLSRGAAERDDRRPGLLGKRRALYTGRGEDEGAGHPRGEGGAAAKEKGDVRAEPARDGEHRQRRERQRPVHANQAADQTDGHA